MKKFFSIVVALALLPVAAATAQTTFTYTAASGVSLFTAVPATATATSGAARLPNFSGTGTLTVTGAGITGSPSGCTVALKYQGNNSTTPTSAVATIGFTPGNSAQTFNVAPAVATGDQYVATYSCGTYPTAGAITASFSPFTTASADPCSSGAKSSVAISQASAGTTQLVALASGKAIYVCGATDGSAGTTPSILLEYGTGISCGTGTTALTGAIPFTSGSAVNIGTSGATVAQAPAGNALCMLTVGIGHYGVLQYVQQ